ncbi:hypothetical protein B0T18DRAFT_447412 [Schizothecium vesticola]|uniref:Uncharacterized protein n=1 Tax=Schizothecium vesticola TaxID=314040 RepID=A0AA40EWZ6_9PEZI|nr:hypothetical protein B0T18DRAFT_447412 [Schizothecium vesticola]
MTKDETQADSGVTETRDELPKMGPLAVLVNPLVPTKDKFLVFSSSAQRTVTIEQRTMEGPVGITISPNHGDQFPELLAYPSSLTAMLLENTICAFGIVGNEGHYKVALVSPAPQTAPQLTPTTPSIAGFSVNKPGAPGFEAYLYFQGVENNEPCLREWPFRLSNFTKPSANPIDKTLPNFLPGTKLAAATDSRGNRWLVYQSSDGTISVYNAKTRANIRIETTKAFVNAFKSPFLGVCVVPADKAVKRDLARVYVYYIGSDGHVHVIFGEVSEKDQALSFAVKTKPAATFDVHAGENAVVIPEEWSQIAVVPWASRVVADPDDAEKTVAKPCNLLFYFDGDTVTQREEPAVSGRCDECDRRRERGEAKALVCLECLGVPKGHDVQVEVTGTFSIKVKPRL